jgi:hypothetical protein
MTQLSGQGARWSQFHFLSMCTFCRSNSCTSVNIIFVYMYKTRNMIYHLVYFEELDSPAVSALRCAISEVKQRWSLNGWPKIYNLELLPASEGTLSHCSRLHLQSLAPTNPHWARGGLWPDLLMCVIHKEGLCPSSGDFNRLMMWWWWWYHLHEFKLEFLTDWW